MLPKRYDPLGRLNVVCPYYTMFPIEFPYRALRNADPGSFVFDPFCGRGTTLYAARLRGVGCAGVDSNPVAAAIAAAKLATTTAEDIVSLCWEIFRRPPSSIDLPDGDFWKWGYHPDTLLEICILREYLLKCNPSDTSIALRALILGLLHGPRTKGEPSYLSNQMPRTYSTKPDAAVEFWERRRLRPHRVNTLALIRRRAKYVFEEVPAPNVGSVIHGDVRTIAFKYNYKFTHIITSPPYLGMRCYVSDQWLRNWFLGADEVVEYDNFGQIGSDTRESFVSQLGYVWKRVARNCTRHARLVIRFGALPSVAEDPSALISESFLQSGARWKVATVRRVDPPPKARRQASQFANNLRAGLNEVDIYAMLDA